MAGVQCLKRLYLLVHEPGLANQPGGTNEAIIQQGREVGLLARQLLPGGIEVDGSSSLEHAIRTTRELIANPEVSLIFEGTFEHGGALIKTDILQRRSGRATPFLCNQLHKSLLTNCFAVRKRRSAFPQSCGLNSIKRPPSRLGIGRAATAQE